MNVSLLNEATARERALSRPRSVYGCEFQYAMRRLDDLFDGNSHFFSD